MNISVLWMITSQRTNTHVPGTNGHNSLGIKTLTTPGAGFPVSCWVRCALTIYVPLLKQKKLLHSDNQQLGHSNSGECGKGYEMSKHGNLKCQKCGYLTNWNK